MNSQCSGGMNNRLHERNGDSGRNGTTSQASMSHGSVKEPLNPGNPAVAPATTINLTKSALPPSNNISALVSQSVNATPREDSSITCESSSVYDKIRHNKVVGQANSIFLPLV